MQALIYYMKLLFTKTWVKKDALAVKQTIMSKNNKYVDEAKIEEGLLKGSLVSIEGDKLYIDTDKYLTNKKRIINMSKHL